MAKLITIANLFSIILLASVFLLVTIQVAEGEKCKQHWANYFCENADIDSDICKNICKQLHPRPGTFGYCVHPHCVCIHKC
ncbi:hypothetical protein HN51_026880 [Arachis hypogaea]|nr:uncharacterized protein DS421_9g255460 [Arachis hypogaea]